MAGLASGFGERVTLKLLLSAFIRGTARHTRSS